MIGQNGWIKSQLDRLKLNHKLIIYSYQNQIKNTLKLLSNSQTSRKKEKEMQKKNSYLFLKPQTITNNKKN